jgi:hypothetical protein
MPSDVFLSGIPPVSIDLGILNFYNFYGRNSHTAVTSKLLQLQNTVKSNKLVIYGFQQILQL